MSWLSSALGDIGSALTGSGQARQSREVSRDIANQQTALQRQIYNDQRGLQQPFYTLGINASNEIADLMGQARVNPTTGKVDNEVPQYQADLAAWEAAGGANSGQPAPNPYDYKGTPENRELLQRRAFDRFEASPQARTMGGQTDYTMQRVGDQAAAMGNALSGANIKDLFDVGRRDANNALMQYMGTLGAGTQGGQASANSQQQAAGQFGANQSNTLSNLGNSLSSSYAQQGAQTSGLMRNALGFFGSF